MTSRLFGFFATHRSRSYDKSGFFVHILCDWPIGIYFIGIEIAWLYLYFTKILFGNIRGKAGTGYFTAHLPSIDAIGIVQKTNKWAGLWAWTMSG
jgi:hypothetical protein